MSHTTGRWASRFVVPMNRRLPLACSRATFSSSASSIWLAMSSASGSFRADGIGAEDGEDAPRLVDVLRADLGVVLPEHLVVVRPQERERRDERPRADPRDEPELRPISGLRPAAEDARAERAVVPAARDRQEVQAAPHGLVLLRVARQRPSERPDQGVLEPLAEIVAPGANARHAGDLRDLGEVLGDGPPLGSGTATDE
jgi:hypothetical protein